MYGPDIERRVLPVISEFTVDSMVRENPRTIIMSGHMNKLRANCKLESMAAYFEDVEPPAHKYLDLAKVEFTEAGDIIVFRVAGLQSWGPWKITSEQPNNGDRLSITAYHRCHPLYVVPTKLINTVVPK